VLPRSPSFQLVRCDHHDATVLFQLTPRINHPLWYNLTLPGLQQVQDIHENHTDTWAAHSRCKIEVREGKVFTGSTTRAREHANGWFCEPFLQHLSLERSYESQTSISTLINVDTENGLASSAAENRNQIDQLASVYCSSSIFNFCTFTSNVATLMIAVLRFANTTGSSLRRRKAPAILQPLLPPQLQRLYLDEVNRKILSCQNDVGACQVLDPAQGLHGICPTLRGRHDKQGTARWWGLECGI